MPTGVMSAATALKIAQANEEAFKLFVLLGGEFSLA
jgi:hypothetical protein